MYIGYAPESTRQDLGDAVVVADPGEGGCGVQYVQDAVILSSNGKLLVGASSMRQRPQVIGQCSGYGAQDRIGLRFIPVDGRLTFLRNAEIILSTRLDPRLRWCPCVQLCAPGDTATLRVTTSFSPLLDPADWKLTEREVARLVEEMKRSEMLGRMNAAEWLSAEPDVAELPLQDASPARQRALNKTPVAAPETEDWDDEDE
eukprot:TRINITY_DN12755_c1_g1_i1.p1 TRINITY_DN12755_c1_g1~~TRINITY_DN12755_c1_g1_i1.p1  ORF type:complete len:222 (+),score=18.79 TRINITY_DN12755_c1_g1_i1:63-668(+)